MAKSTVEKSSGAERREFCRIEDEVSLRYRAITEADVSGMLKKLRDELPDRFTAASTFVATSRQMNTLLRRIQSESADLAKYLEAIDTKLNMLAQMFVAEEMDVEDQPACQVNMSANGMAFTTANSYAPGQMLELRMVLFPSLTGILTCARVVHCTKQEDPEPGSGFQVAVEFCHLRSEDQDLLVKHVFSKQMEQRRQQRFMQDVLNEGDKP